MDNHDTALIRWRDLPAALGLLTRLPVPVDMDKASARGANAAWAYPLAGALIGVILAAATALLLWVGLPGGIVAALVLALSVIVTGAMHEDGLADSADGLWGGWDRDKRLAIMKDSNIGVYGVIALALSLLIRWMVLVVVVATGTYWTIFIVIGALSRTGMVVLMRALPHARQSGLSHSVGQPRKGAVWLAIGIGAAIGFGLGGVLLIGATFIATLICGLIAKVKIGGQTGDILGATQQVSEVAMLLVLVTQFSS